MHAQAGRSTVIVKSRRRRRGRRMDLGKRVEMKSAAVSREGDEDDEGEREREFEEMLLREHSVSTDMGSLDWKRMKIPPVLTSSQSARLFKTMQPMKVHQQIALPDQFIHSFFNFICNNKRNNFCVFSFIQAIFEVQESLREELQRDPTDAELAEATGMTVHQLRRRLDVGRAARNKLIKVKMQPVLFLSGL
jgi:RNA polymerase sigma factor